MGLWLIGVLHFLHLSARRQAAAGSSGTHRPCQFAMEDDVQRWTVTYTKHVKQKRKVYQDGILELHSSRRKVILYDEGDKLLESRFVNKDDVVRSGETLAFDFFLVDIGEPCGGHKPASKLPCGEKDSKVTDKQRLSHNSGCFSNITSVGRRPLLGMVKGCKVTLSPSENVIREFRLHEMNKYGSSSGSVDMIKSSTTEWQVLYTTQVTQKAKKFHDGFLQLLVQGSLRRQVMLCDITRRTLESRFLKKHEIVCSGESLAFEGHLVEIGEHIGDTKAVTDSRFQGQDCKRVGKTDIANTQAKLPTNKNFPVGKTPNKTSLGKLNDFNNSSSAVETVNFSWGSSADKPRRAVHTILSVLRKPILIKEDTLNKTSLAEQHKSHAEECNGNAQGELSDKISDHDCQIKVLKPGSNDVLAAAEKCTFQQNRRECHVESSSYLSSGTTYCTPPVLSVHSIDKNETLSKSSPVEPHSLVATSPEPIELATFPGSNEEVETENPTEAFSEMITETDAAATIGFNLSKFPEDNCTEEMDEYPSFDLGI